MCHDVLVTPLEVQFVLSVHLKAARTSIVHPLSGHESGFARNKIKIGVVMASGCPKKKKFMSYYKECIRYLITSTAASIVAPAVIRRFQFRGSHKEQVH